MHGTNGTTGISMNIETITKLYRLDADLECRIRKVNNCGFEMFYADFYTRSTQRLMKTTPCYWSKEYVLNIFSAYANNYKNT